MKYSDKLRDPRWQKKRLKILERDNWACHLCCDTTKTLHVHHSIYKGEPWDVPDNKLHAVCEVCHKILHLDMTDLEFLLYTLSLKLSGDNLKTKIGIRDKTLSELLKRNP